MFNFFQKAVVEQKGKVLEDARYKHMMALSLDEKTGYQQGLIRCIASRTGDVKEKGFVDRSFLHHVFRNDSGKLVVGEKLTMKGEEDLIKKFSGQDWDFIGFEDPDIWNDPDDGKTHIYFSIPLKPKKEGDKTRIYLGHAEGDDLNSLTITEPVLF